MSDQRLSLKKEDTMGTLRLLVAGGDEIIRKGLCTLVREQPDWDLAAEARDGREAVERTKQVKPDVAILDIDMPSLNGFDATRQIAKGALNTKVLLRASRDTDQLLPLALEAGARGYLLKSDSADDLVSAVEALRHGRSFFTGRAAQEVLRGYLETMEKTKEAGYKDARRLSGREREVVQLLAEGYSSKQVAVALNISTKTADTHRANLMRKIACHSLAGVVRYAIRNHIIDA
jgi:DNA-binding NarL/FixJ family response regulator